MSVPEHFADCFNYYLFNGEQIIKAANLKPLDPTELTIISEDSTDETVEKIRDLLKQCIVMWDHKATYLLLGIENQSDIHYALPVKNMNYDALNYGKQVSDIAKDGVIICVNNKYHCDMTVQALKHKKHVLCEKPMAVTVEEAKEMIEASKEEGCYLMIAHQQRFVPVNQKLKEVLTTKDLGKIISFATAFCHSGPEFWSVDKTKGTWFLNKKEAGLGALGDIGIHKADLIRWFIGEDIKYVTSVLGTLDKKDAEGNYIGMEDNAFAILESESGIIGTLEASWTHYGKGENRTKVSCENGLVEAVGESKIVVRYKDKSKEKEVFEIKNSTSLMAETFAECIIEGKEPEISGEEGLKALEIVFTCVESSEKHARVEI